MLNSQSRRGSSPKTLLVWQQGWDEESFTGKTTLNQEIMRFDTLTMNQRNREQNCLNWLNHAKWSLILNFINSTSPTFPAPFIFFKGFFMNYFWAKNISWHINVKQWENINKEREEFLFFIPCSKSWRIYEAILRLWRHCLERFFSQLKAIIMLKLTSNPANGNNVHFFLRVSRKREVVNMVGGHIINT